MSSFSWSVLRSVDLLAVRFEFFNLALVEEGPDAGRLVREQAGEEAFVVVHFPPQHTAEQPDPQAQGAGSTVLARGFVSGPSRLAFRVPPGTDRLPFTLEALLDWSSLEASLVPAAEPPADPAQVPPLRSPEATETAIELPYRLLLSPNAGGGWAHSVGPVTHGGLTELWHTRLGAGRTGTDGTAPPDPDRDPAGHGPAGGGRVDEERAAGREVRAVYSLDRDLPPPAVPTAPTPQQRDDIVRLSADFSLLRTEEQYLPEPVGVDRLMLSSRGGWLRARGDWDRPASLGPGLSEWRHVATQGRDHFVQVTEKGFLFPFGHRAVHITITERVVEEGGGTRAAPLRTSEFVVVREPVKTYASGEFPHGGREMPFLRGVRVLTPSALTKPAPIADGGGSFWIMRKDAETAPVLFHVAGTDVTGRETDFSVALAFVPEGIPPQALPKVAEAYEKADSDPQDPGRSRRRASVAGADVAFAPPADPAAPGDTTLITQALAFGASAAAGAPADGGPPFRPVLGEAEVRLPAVEQIVGGSHPARIALADAFLNAGPEAAANRAQLFAELLPGALPPGAQPVPGVLDVAVPAERGAALARPDLAVRGLSRTLGPVGGDLSQLAEGVFDPRKFFPGSAKVLGAVRLSDLVSAEFAPDQFPRMISRATPTSVVTTLDWEPGTGADRPAILPLRPRPGGISLSLHTRTERPLDGSPPRSTVTTDLRNFTFDFLGVLEVHFNALSFRSENDGKPDVSAELASEGVVFKPPLSFLNTLRRFIPTDGFSDPPALEVGPTGATVGYSLALPPVEAGVFALKNVKLGASLHLPFTDGRASLRFNFSERHDEFLLSVQGIGGGGFFTVALGLDGIETIEAALEFGASVSLNLGVASGSVSVMAGVYFRHRVLDRTPVPVLEKTELTGYLRINGEVEVLGLVSVSIELFMGLTYETGPERIEGVATLTVKIDLTLFSKSVELTVRRTFARGGDDPAFGDVVAEEDWAAYADAFAGPV
ncbi:hypothetical protein [Streptomyces sp. HB2AG]|uniref:hypothetical protein n=1 Tax=Streptomyces sp. HB2AG TaxID=2983400 RepID=UPI0022AA51C8|nr:hypothetical protein [Streptomyces sp. HB2AG]MCZ2525287.1 hypothetical protein [Streptomyces sp. HB2AG]